jgi:hypothetical protein
MTGGGYRPDSVPRRAAPIHLGRALPRGSSSQPGDLTRHRRDTGTGYPWSPYLALLRMGFTVPPPFPEERCALTAPFHPYHRSTRGRSVLCGTFPRVAAAGGYPACRLSRSPDLPPGPRPRRTPTSSSHREDTIQTQRRGDSVWRRSDWSVDAAHGVPG